MRIWKLVAGILSFVFIIIVIFQSCAAGVVNVLESNGESSGSAGVLIAILMLAGGIVSIATRNSLGNGGNIALIVIYGLAYVFGTLMAGSYSDLHVWSWWCLINALIATSAVIYDSMSVNRMTEAYAMAKIQDRNMPGGNVPNWYYQFNNQWYGPFTREQIPTLTNGGYLKPDTPVYYEGAQQAVYASNSAIRSYIPGAVIPPHSSGPMIVSVLVSVAIGILCMIISISAAKAHEEKKSAEKEDKSIVDQIDDAVDTIDSLNALIYDSDDESKAKSGMSDEKSIDNENEVSSGSIEDTDLSDTFSLDASEEQNSSEADTDLVNYSMSVQNAIKAAKSYLDTSSFSRDGLIAQLSSEYGSNYPIDDAKEAVDYMESKGLVDWNEQAYQSARDYLNTSSFSRQGLMDQLTSEYGSQFTSDQAEYGITKMESTGEVDWNEQAANAAQEYLNVSDFSRDQLIDQLTSEYGSKFTLEQAEYGVSAVGY